MKRTMISLLLAVLILASCLPAVAASATDLPTLLFETVKWSVDFPKDAQLVQATEYMCKIDDIQLHLLLAEVTQHDDMNNLYGNSSRIILIDLDTGIVLTHTNVVWPESSDISTHEDALNMLFSCYDSYLQGYNPFIFADHEITFPFDQGTVDSINQQLNQYFCPPVQEAQ